MEPLYSVGDRVRIISIENCSLSSSLARYRGAEGVICAVNDGPASEYGGCAAHSYAIDFAQSPKDIGGHNCFTNSGIEQVQSGKGYWLKFDCVELVEPEFDDEIDVSDFL